MDGNKHILIKIKNSVKQEDPDAEVILYGSRARGDNNNESDWDILILTDNKNSIYEIEDKFRTNLYEIELETGQIISTLVYSKDYWTNKLKYTPLYKIVTKEGLTL